MPDDGLHAYRCGALAIQERILHHGDLIARPAPVAAQLRDRGLADGAIAGECHRVGIRPGFDVSLYDLQVTQEHQAVGRSDPSLVIVALISGDGIGWLLADDQAGGKVPIPYRGDHLYWCFADVPASGGYILHDGSHFRMVELRCTLDFLARTGLLEQLYALTPAHPAHLVSNPHVWIGMTDLPVSLARIAQQIIVQGSTPGHDLVLEARVLDLFSSAIDLLRQPIINTDRRRDRDQRCLERARAILLDDPSRLWTIRDLARLVGMNEKKLKAAFRNRFGQTIRAFQQDARLEVGQQMLRRGASVTETSLAVGFANPSYFTQLFSRRYGCLPSMIRRDPCDPGGRVG